MTPLIAKIEALITPDITPEAAQLLRQAVEVERNREPQDICGLCGEPGANKIPHPIHWPGERLPDSELVHDECEKEECGRAHAALTDTQRRSFLGLL